MNGTEEEEISGKESEDDVAENGDPLRSPLKHIWEML